jgi:hypothetical protein
MAANAEEGQTNGEPVDDTEEDLESNDGVDHALEELLCKDSVLLN